MTVPRPNLGEYQWVWDAICWVAGGSAWPEGDEDKLRELGEAWGDLSGAIADSLREADAAAVDIITSWGGDAGIALMGYWNQLAVGPETGLPVIQEIAADLRQGCDATALQIEYTKLIILITVLVTVIMIFISLLLAWLGGVSAVGIPGYLAAGRQAITVAFQKLLAALGRQLISKAALKTFVRAVAAGAARRVTAAAARRTATQVARQALRQVGLQVVLQVGTEFAAQSYQIARGHRDGYDTQQIGIGALSAALAGPLTVGIYAVPVRRQGWLVEAGRDAVANVIAMPVSSVVATGIVTGRFEIPDNFGQQLLAAAAQGGIMSVGFSAAGAGGQRLADATNAAMDLRSTRPTPGLDLGADLRSPDHGAAVDPTVPVDVAEPVVVGAGAGAAGAVPTVGATSGGGTSSAGTAAGSGPAPPPRSGDAAASTAGTSPGSRAGDPSRAVSADTAAPAPPLPVDSSPPVERPIADLPERPVADRPAGSVTDGPVADRPAGSLTDGPVADRPVAAAGDGPGRHDTDPGGQAIGELAHRPPEHGSVPAPVDRAIVDRTIMDRASLDRTTVDRTTVDRAIVDRTTVDRAGGPPPDRVSSTPERVASTPPDRFGGPTDRSGPATPDRAVGAPSDRATGAPADRGGVGRATERPATDRPVAGADPSRPVAERPIAAAGEPAPATAGADPQTGDSPAARDADGGRPDGGGGGPHDPGGPPGGGPGDRGPWDIHPEEVQLSQQRTAAGTNSYEGPVRQFEGDVGGPEARHATSEVSRNFADALLKKAVAESVGLNRLPFTAGALLAPDGPEAGTLHTHTAVRGAPPDVHPLVERVLAQIEADRIASGDRVGLGHGKCAEVALVSDRLHALEDAWHRAGGEGELPLEVAMDSLRGGMVDTNVVKGSRQIAAQSPIAPCSSCQAMLDYFGITHLHDDRPGPYGGTPPPDGPPPSPGITATEVPSSEFHGHGRPVAEPDVVARHGEEVLREAGERLPGVAAVEPGRDGTFTVTATDPVRAGGADQVTVRVVADAIAPDQVARTVVDPPSGTYVITLSERVADAHVPRAIAHELAEIFAARRAGDLDLTGPVPPDALHAGPHDPAARLSPHDEGRLAELDLLADRVAHGDADARAEAGALIDHLGLRDRDPDAAIRRELVEPLVSDATRSLLDNPPPADSGPPPDAGPPGDGGPPSDGGPGVHVDEARELAIDVVMDRLGIDGEQVAEAIGRAYDVAYENTAPLIVKTAAEMLVDLKADVAANPNTTVVFLGRDGHSLAVATQVLDPAFFDAHCVEVTVSRAAVDGALQDLEASRGLSFDHVRDFRVDPAKFTGDRAGAYYRLTEYLARAGVPVLPSHAGAPGDVTVVGWGRDVSLVDTSFKGSVQEMLAAIYPETTFRGRYAFFGESPLDPHPGTKTGYVVHLDAGESNGGRPMQVLPDDPSLTFAHQDAIGVIEETLHGSLSSPRDIGPDGPVQHPLHRDQAPAAGINPERIAEPYRDPLVREAVMDVNLLAVVNYAEHVAAVRDSGGAWYDIMVRDAGAFRDRLRDWIAGNSVDPRFQEVMDSFVRRPDKGLVVTLADAMTSAGLSPDQARAVWLQYDQLRTMQDRSTFVATFRHTTGQG